MDKLEKWADDLKSALEYKLKELDRKIKFLKIKSKKILKLDEKLKAALMPTMDESYRKPEICQKPLTN